MSATVLKIFDISYLGLENSFRQLWATTRESQLTLPFSLSSSALTTSSISSSGTKPGLSASLHRSRIMTGPTPIGYHLFGSFADFRLGHNLFAQYITSRYECNIIIFDQSINQQRSSMPSRKLTSHSMYPSQSA
jgi:hypothetical protein